MAVEEEARETLQLQRVDELASQLAIAHVIDIPMRTRLDHRTSARDTRAPHLFLILVCRRCNTLHCTSASRGVYDIYNFAWVD